MIQKALLTTADDLWRLPARDMRHELVRGELRTMAPAGAEHGNLGIRFAVHLYPHVLERQLGEVFGADAGFLIARDPDTVLSPDCAFVSAARLAVQPITAKYWPGAPDLAVEVLSPSDTYSELDEKIEVWLRHGTHAVVLVDPRRRVVSVYRGDGGVQRLTRDDALELPELLPGWTLPLERLFPG